MTVHFTKFKIEVSCIFDTSEKIPYDKCKIYKTFSRWDHMNRLSEYRKSKHISQLELAKKVNVSRQTINMIENNKYNPSLNLCINICLALDVTLNDIFWKE